MLILMYFIRKNKVKNTQRSKLLASLNNDDTLIKIFADYLDYWIDTSAKPHVLKRYSGKTSMWTSIATTYIKIEASGIGTQFKQYDGVQITGIDASIGLPDLEGQTSVLQDVSDDAVTVIGFLDTTQEQMTQSTAITLRRRMPIMDFVIESNNRLWGCRYGENLDGEIVNEIYCSKLGDFKNWFTYQGLSTDSYAASCGTDGQWTGAISYNNYPLFFKENYLHKVMGNVPAQYQITSTPVRGVMKGAGNSLAIVNETLFYKSRNGICAYTGSLPTEIGTEFGEIKYTAVDETNADFLRNGAVSGSFQNKYYISMKSEVDGRWNLFVFDTQYKLWHREDNTRADAFCVCRNELYYIDHEDKVIKTVTGTGTRDESPVSWKFETGLLGIDYIDKKYISRIVIRMALEIGTRVSIFIQYDSCGEWEHISSLTGTSLRSFALPIKPKRCDHFRLRMVGKGDAKIFSIAKNIEQGSDMDG